MAQTGAALRCLKEDIIELFQLTEDGAVYRQVLDRVPAAEEQTSFDVLVESCSAALPPALPLRINDGPCHSFAQAFEGSSQQSPTDPLAWLTSPCTKEPSAKAPPGPYSRYSSI